MIELLKKEQEKRGDVEVVLYGHYGAESDVFEVAEDKHIPKKERDKLWIWTDICTG
jgi:hypothetical protein